MQIEPFGKHQDRVSTAIMVLIGGSVVGLAVAGVGQANGQNELMGGGALILIGSVVYFWMVVVMTIAAGVDYVKLIADQQAVSITRKAGGDGKSSAAPPSAPGYKPRPLGKPEI